MSLKRIFSYISEIDLSRKKTRQILWLLSFLIYFTVFFLIQKFNSSSLLYGDEWEYQAQAVNFAKGLGFPIHGGLLKFEDYKFLEGSNDYVSIFTSENVIDSYRTPLFPLFTGIVYLIFGINPYLLKLIQLIFYVIISCGLPLIGWYYWKKKGYLAGILAGIFYISTTYQYAGSVLTEPLVSLVVYLIIVFWIRYESKSTYFNAAIIGLFLGLSWLTKGILMPIACFVMLLLFVKFIRLKRRSIFYQLLTIGVTFLLPVAIYSIFLNSKIDRFVFISTQGEAIMLDSHNEYMKNGFWAPDWRQYSNSFYNTDKMKNKPAIVRVVNFYKFHPELIIKLAKDKLISGFIGFYSFWLLLVILFADGLLSLSRRLIKHSLLFRFSAYFIFILFIAVLVMVIQMIYGNLYFLTDKLVHTITVYSAYFIWVFLAGSIIFLLGWVNKRFRNIPIIFVIIIISFVIMTVLTCLPIRELRFLKVIDFVFLLMGFYALINFTINIFQQKPDTFRIPMKNSTEPLGY